MSRLRLFLHGVASSNVSLATSVVYSLVSIPLALSFLTTKQFGIWALLSQIVSYMWLIDLGMSPSVGRLLIERKDRPDDGAYGSLIKTGFLVTATQGMLVLAAGTVLAPVLSRIFDIPADLHATFCALVRWQSAITAVTLGTRMFRNLLYAHQRNDLVNYTLAASLLVGLATLWLALRWHAGVQSILWSNASAMLFAVPVFWWNCVRLRLFPSPGTWGRAAWREFQEAFVYGRDVFIVQIGSMLIMAAQTVIVSRNFGLEGFAIWSVATKAFFLLCSLFWQGFDVSMPAFSEMMVRGERERLRRRFAGMVVISETLSGVVAVIYAVCNSSFIFVWTHGRFSWSVRNDVLLGAWMIVSVFIHINGSFIILTKRLAGMRYVYPLEGLAFITVASLATPRGGIPAMIGCSLVCSLCFSCPYGIRRVNEYFQFAILELERLWLAPLGRIFVFLLPVALATWWVANQLNPVSRLILSAVVDGAIGGLLFLRLGIPADLQAEALNRLPPSVRPALEKLMGRQRPAA